MKLGGLKLGGIGLKKGLTGLNFEGTGLKRRSRGPKLERVRPNVGPYKPELGEMGLKNKAGRSESEPYNPEFRGNRLEKRGRKA